MAPLPQTPPITTPAEFRTHIEDIRSTFIQYDPENIDAKSFAVARDSVINFCDELDSWNNGVEELRETTDATIAGMAEHKIIFDRLRNDTQAAIAVVGALLFSSLLANAIMVLCLFIF